MSVMDSVKDFFTPKEERISAEGGDEKRFVLRSYPIGGMTLFMITDRKTGVSYLTKAGSDCPLTPLLDADGKPFISRFR
ncbi:MAG: hypothetical protein IKI58_06320 [Oscillospiraceae bacterium]|nr:hypothetical protein [Oscillospiraceae bacterium]